MRRTKAVAAADQTGRRVEAARALSIWLFIPVIVPDGAERIASR